MITNRVLIGASLLFAISALAQSGPERGIISLKPWAAPLYWQPTPEEAHAQSPIGSLVFVGMTPCRVADTRTGLGGNQLAQGQTGTYAIQSGAGQTACANIPSIAQAYSLNVTVVPPGFLGFITVYPTGQTRPGSSSLNDPVVGGVIANAVVVAAGTGGQISVFANNPTDIVIDINGYYAPQSGITLAQGSAGAPSLSFSGDSGTGVYSPAAGTVSIATAGTNAVNVVGGSVGIGTNTPAGLLHVKGASPVRILGDTTTLAGSEYVDFFARSSIFSSDLGGMRIQRQPSGNIDTAFWAAQAGSSATEVMRVTGSGHVLIGNTNPDPLGKLEVTGSANPYGVYVTAGPSSTDTGVAAYAPSGRAVDGESQSGVGIWGFSSSGNGVSGGSNTGYAGYFGGDVRVTGNLTKTSGSFQIDHPLDPANKYLSHSFVESPDMKNIYDGNAVLDRHGKAWITLPEWFQVLNRDFRYQLTALGAPGPKLCVASEIEGNRFQIAGGKAGMKVSWQVTGIRQDPYAEAHRIQVEQDKPTDERGYYLSPVEYGQPKEKGIRYANGARRALN